MRKALAAFLAIVMATGLVITQVGAGTAENPLTINPTEGVPGDTIAAQVDPDTIDEECETTEAAFGAVITPWVTESVTQLGYNPTTTPPSDLEELASALMTGTLDTLSGDADLAEPVLSEFFALAFADIGTGEPIGDTTTFDRNTGEGQIETPDVDPGLYAVAATCVFPEATPENFAAAIAAGAAYLQSEHGDFGTFDPTNPAVAQGAAGAMFPEMVESQGGPWTQPFTVTEALPALDPMVEAFCGVLLDLSGIEATITEALAVIPADDGTKTDQEWADDFDWDTIEAELRAMGETVQELLDTGDATRVGEVSPQWELVTEQLRDLLNALEAVDYDLSTPTGRQIAGQLTAESDGEADPEVEAATAALTDFFLTTCVESESATPVEEQPRFTG